jgi:hypothetical protein
MYLIDTRKDVFTINQNGLKRAASIVVESNLKLLDGCVNVSNRLFNLLTIIR